MMQEHGPWQITDTKRQYENPWIRVDEHAVIHPNGKAGIFGIVSILPGVAVLAMDEEQNVYLCREFRFAKGYESIEAVCGGMNQNETYLQAAQRELREELGIEAADWTDLGEVNSFTTVVDSPQRIFLAQQLSFYDAQPEGSEQIAMVKLPFKDVLQAVVNGIITHDLTCILVLKTYLKTLYLNFAL